MPIMKPTSGSGSSKPRGYTQVQLNKAKSIKASKKVYNTKTAAAVMVTAGYPGVASAKNVDAALGNFKAAERNAKTAHAAYVRAVKMANKKK